MIWYYICSTINKGLKMKKAIIFSIMFCGFALLASAQSDAASSTATAVKTEDQKSTEIKPVDATPSVTTTTSTVEKKQCAGMTGSGCSKSGEVKTCCKAKVGATVTPNSTTTTESADKTIDPAADKTKAGSCSGEHKDCCKKKAEENKSGS
jgi:hypothetical protein